MIILPINRSVFACILLLFLTFCATPNYAAFPIKEDAIIIVNKECPVMAAPNTDWREKIENESKWKWLGAFSLIIALGGIALFLAGFVNPFLFIPAAIVSLAALISGIIAFNIRDSIMGLFGIILASAVVASLLLLMLFALAWEASMR